VSVQNAITQLELRVVLERRKGNASRIANPYPTHLSLNNKYR